MTESEILKEIKKIDKTGILLKQLHEKLQNLAKDEINKVIKDYVNARPISAYEESGAGFVAKIFHSLFTSNAAYLQIQDRLGKIVNTRGLLEDFKQNTLVAMDKQYEHSGRIGAITAQMDFRPEKEYEKQILDAISYAFYGGELEKEKLDLLINPNEILDGETSKGTVVFSPNKGFVGPVENEVSTALRDYFVDKYSKELKHHIQEFLEDEV